jgi:hypothetical protein
VATGLAQGMFHHGDVRFGSALWILVVFFVTEPKPLQSDAQIGREPLRVHKQERAIVRREALIFCPSPPLAKAANLSPNSLYTRNSQVAVDRKDQRLNPCVTANIFPQRGGLVSGLRGDLPLSDNHQTPELLHESNQCLPAH